MPWSRMRPLAFNRSVPHFIFRQLDINKRTLHCSRMVKAQDNPPDDPHQFAEKLMGKQTRRDKLIASKGYFHEMVEINKTKGKPWVAAAGVRPASEAELFPELTCDSLASSVGKDFVFPSVCFGKVSLVVISFKQFGFAQLSSWIDPFLEFAVDDAQGYGRNGEKKSGQHRKRNNSGGGAVQTSKAGSGGGVPLTQLVQVSAMEGGFVANLLRGNVKTGLLTHTPPDRHSTSALFVGDVDPLCEGLDIDNRLVGHVFLVDVEGRVRWRACGAATDVELKRLKDAHAELLLLR